MRPVYGTLILLFLMVTFHEICAAGVCGSHISKIVHGNQYDSRFSMDKIFCDSTNEIFGKNYWLTENAYTGEAFVADLEYIHDVIGVKLRNTHNGHAKDRSTKKFRVSIGNSASGPWTKLLTQELVDSRKEDPPPLQHFKGGKTVMGRFIMFEILSYWGKGGGLKYFDIIPAGSGVCGNHITEIVRGNQYGSKFSVDKIFCDSTNEIFGENYWLTENAYTGEAFVAHLESIHDVIGVKLRNTHNGFANDRSTEKFRVSIGYGTRGPWTELLTQELVDKRNIDIPALQHFKGRKAVMGKYIKFDILGYWGEGGGLTYFDIIPAGSGVCGSHITKIVDGYQYQYDRRFSVDKIFCDYKYEFFGHNYWLTKDAHTGVAFIADLEYVHDVIGVKLRNTHNSFAKDRSTKKFRVSIGYDLGGLWTDLLTEELVDSRNEYLPSFQHFKGGKAVMGRFIKFDILSYWGHGGGLKYFNIIPAGSGDCGSHISRIVRGNQYDSRLSVDKIFCDSTNEITGENYWLTKDAHTGQAFIADLGYVHDVIGVKLRNTHNGHTKDRSTKKFNVSIGYGTRGPWTPLLTQELVDSRNHNPPTLEQFIGKKAVVGRFIRFDILDYWGSGGGLKYFNIIPAGSGVCGSHISKIVHGNQYDSRFSMDKIFCDSTNEVFGENYWMTENAYTGEAFIAELEYVHNVIGVKLRNTHNADQKDRSTKKFRVSIGNSAGGPWTPLLTQELEDSIWHLWNFWNWKRPSLQHFMGRKAVMGRFIKFDILSYRGKGGGLKYFNIISAGTTTAPGTCQCGVKAAKRIVGGTEANPGEWPWIVVHNRGSTDGRHPGGCGGTLVASNWIITAAHCFYRYDDTIKKKKQVYFKDTISMVIGEHDIRTADDSYDGKRKNLEIEELIIHKYYNTGTYQNDIALLKLKEALDLSVYMPACLPAKGLDWTGQTGWVYGWGKLEYGTKKKPKVLMETFQTIITDDVCEKGRGKIYKTDNKTGLSTGVLVDVSMKGLISKDDMLCAEKTGQDSCQGDSGGPFTVEVDGKHFLAGVVSWGFGCAAEGLAGVYSDVSFFRDWIDTNVAAHGGATFCP